jgi:hypothetical protein
MYYSFLFVDITNSYPRGGATHFVRFALLQYRIYLVHKTVMHFLAPNSENVDKIFNLKQ